MGLFCFFFLKLKFSRCLTSSSFRSTEKITHFHRNRFVEAVMLALVICIDLPCIYSGHDSVLLKGKTVLPCWHPCVTEGSWKMERFPGRFLLLSGMALALTTSQTALLQGHVTGGWASGLERLLTKLFTSENHLVLHIMGLFFFVFQLNSGSYRQKKKK